MRYGANSGISPLMQNYQAGFDRRMEGMRTDDQLQNSALQRMINQNTETRTQEMHPLKMQNQQLTNTGQNLTNQKTQQETDHAAAEEERKKFEQHEKEAKALADSYGQLASELESVPEGMRADILNSRWGKTPQGRQMMDGFLAQMRAGKFTAKEIPKVLADMNKAIIERSMEYRKTLDAAQVRADASTQNALTAAERARDVANINAQKATEVGVIRANAQREISDSKLATIREENEKKRKHEIAKLERTYELKGKLEAEKAKAKSQQDPKTFEALAARLESEANSTEDPTKKAELQALADDAFNRAATLRAAGKDLTKPAIVDKPDGKKGIANESTIPKAPARGSNAIKGTGEFEGFTITPRK